MWTDPIVAEVRRAREAYARRFNYDLDRIVADLRKKEKKHDAMAKKAAATRKTKPSKRRRAA